MNRQSFRQIRLSNWVKQIRAAKPHGKISSGSGILTRFRSKQVVIGLLVLFIPIWIGAAEPHWSVLSAFAQNIGGPNEAYSIGAADVFLNPALLSKNNRPEIQLSNLLSSSKIRYLNAAALLVVSSRQKIGVGVFSTNLPRGERYANRQTALLYAENYQTRIVLGYAYKIKKSALGISIKYVRLSGRVRPLSWVNIDAGIVAQISQKIRWGLVGQNIFQELQKESKEVARIGSGLVWQPFNDFGEKLQLLFSAERNGEERALFNYGGIFYPFRSREMLKTITFRAGVGNFNYQSINRGNNNFLLIRQQRTLKIGAGVLLQATDKFLVNLDYCFQFNQFSQNLHVVSTRFRL